MILPPAEALSERAIVLRTAAAMTVAMFFFALLDSTAKYLSGIYAISLVVFVRYASHLLLLAAFFAASGRLRRALHSANPRLQLLRSANLVVITLLFFSALKFLPLVESLAIMLLTPLFVTILSLTLLREKVGYHRLAGIGIGLLGACLVLRPGGAVFQPAALLALGASVGYATYQILTRRVSAIDSTDTTALYSSLVGTLVTGIAMPFALAEGGGLSPRDTLFAAAMGANAVFAHGLLVVAFATAPASLATGFGYTNMLWISLFGWLFFREFPDTLTWVGILTICAGGFYILRRETRRGLPPGQTHRSSFVPHRMRVPHRKRASDESPKSRTDEP